MKEITPKTTQCPHCNGRGKIEHYLGKWDFSFGHYRRLCEDITCGFCGGSREVFYIGDIKEMRKDYEKWQINPYLVKPKDNTKDN